MTIRYLPPPKRPYKHVTEEQVQAALANYFDYKRNLCFRSVFLYDWESDFLVVTPSGYTWEVEIKISLQDWKADAEKQKWGSPRIKDLSRFYYAVPDKLLEHNIPEFVPEWAGVLVIKRKNGKLFIRTVRKPSGKKGKKLTNSEMLRLYKSTYFRFWRNNALDPDLVGGVDCTEDNILKDLENS